jgi:hypothetical protein
MTETTKHTTESTKEIARTPADLRAIGMTPREIYRLRTLRDCIGCYPHLEFFGNDEWRQLLFMKWRYDHGEYVDDMPPDTIIVNKQLSEE